MNRQVLKQIVKEAGNVVMEYYRKNPDVEIKADNSPVTEADLAVHRFLTAKLAATGTPVLSEEAAPTGPENKKQLWVIDPIDGTKDFIQESGDFAVMVALIEEGSPILSVVYAPARGELLSAEKGKGAFLEKNNTELEIRVSNISDTKHARLVASRNHPNNLTEKLEHDLEIATVIPLGSIGVKLACIASGEADIALYSTNKLGWWDVAPPQLILEEAGGTVTGTDGSKIRYIGSSYQVEQGVLATNSILHNSALKVLN